MKNVPSASRASIWRGSWFVLDDQERRFALWVSPWGKEELYVNGRLVSACRKIAFTGSHAHAIGDESYELKLRVTSVLGGLVQCALYRNGEFICGQRNKVSLRGYAFVALAAPAS